MVFDSLAAAGSVTVGGKTLKQRLRVERANGTGAGGGSFQED